MYIFPLKALALDQMRKLQSLVKAMPNNRLKLALMTGDTPATERQRFLSPTLQTSWQSAPTYCITIFIMCVVGMSIQHQIVKAVPLVVLSSSLDVDELAIQKESRNIGYFFDTCEGRNGAAEAIFSDFTKFAAASYALAAECDCEAGCPRCLHSTACPQHNQPLHKDVGLFFLDAISP
ncbi:Zn-binding domain-containing protein [Nostoc sp.]|uniref:Zn-binding domain-containing protein n=2 Tax=Nostoc sp. TaxID=1180 RepID=UPI002FF8E315